MASKRISTFILCGMLLSIGLLFQIVFTEKAYAQVSLDALVGEKTEYTYVSNTSSLRFNTDENAACYVIPKEMTSTSSGEYYHKLWIYPKAGANTTQMNTVVEVYDYQAGCNIDLIIIKSTVSTQEITACTGETIDININFFSNEYLPDSVGGAVKNINICFSEDVASYDLDSFVRTNSPLDTYDGSGVFEYNYNAKIKFHDSGEYLAYIFSDKNEILKAVSINISDHTYDEGEVTIESTCTSEGELTKTCTKCHHILTEKLKKTDHKWGTEFVIDQEPTCTLEGKKSLHCEICDGINANTMITIPKTKHSWNIEYTVDKDASCEENGSKSIHCMICNTTKDGSEIMIPSTGHSYTKYINNEDASCESDGTETAECDNGCGTKKTRTSQGSKLGHSFGEWIEIKSPDCENKGYSQRICKNCKLIDTKELDATGHKWDDVFTIDKNATCIEDGCKSIHCSKCTAAKNSIIIPAAGHQSEKNIIPATIEKNGTITNVCPTCKTVLSAATINKVSTCFLSTSSYVYTGQAQNPTVTVKDSKGKNLVKNNDYTMHYTPGRTNVGTYKVTITLQGNYSGTITKVFKINPKSTVVKSLSPSKRAFTVRWYKISSQTTGYQIMYASDSKFTKGKKTVTLKSSKVTAKKISKLSAKKKYYVKLRTYKKIGNAYYYSAWSKPKNVTTR